MFDFVKNLTGRRPESLLPVYCLEQLELKY